MVVHAGGEVKVDAAAGAYGAACRGLIARPARAGGCCAEKP